MNTIHHYAKTGPFLHLHYCTELYLAAARLLIRLLIPPEVLHLPFHHLPFHLVAGNAFVLGSANILSKENHTQGIRYLYGLCCDGNFTGG